MQLFNKLKSVKYNDLHNGAIMLCKTQNIFFLNYTVNVSYKLETNSLIITLNILEKSI